jgi:Xaa-Pro dipeptidase
MALHFSKEEFSKRKQEVLKAMKEPKLDALLMFFSLNFFILIPT